MRRIGKEIKQTCVTTGLALSMRHDTIKIRWDCTYNDQYLEDTGGRQEVSVGSEAPSDLHVIERRCACLLVFFNWRQVIQCPSTPLDRFHAALSLRPAATNCSYPDWFDLRRCRHPEKKFIGKDTVMTMFCLPLLAVIVFLRSNFIQICIYDLLQGCR